MAKYFIVFAFLFKIGIKPTYKQMEYDEGVLKVDSRNNFLSGFLDKVRF